MNNDAERILGLDEWAGLSGLGMKREALTKARRALKSHDMTSNDFNNALNVILTHADKCKPWTPVVETAYARLQKRDKKAVRRWMLYFYCCSRNHEAASKFIPHRFSGEFDIAELAFTCETWLELKRMDEMDKLAKRLSLAFKVAEHPSMLPHLTGYLGEYYARKGLWNKAVKLWESVQLDKIHCQSAVESIVEIHVAGALLAIKRGLELVDKFNREFDPQMETTLPGNDKKIQQHTEKKFRKLKKILEKIMSEKRQEELGLN
jgi:hypothetical protein